MPLNTEDCRKERSIMNRTARFGLLATCVTVGLVLIIVFTVFLRPKQSTLTATPVTQTTVNCVGGSEKSALMQDTEIKTILQTKYGLTVNFSAMGSLAQVTMPTDEIKQKALD